MTWLELSVCSPSEFVEPLSQVFLKYGHGSVVIEEDGGFNPDDGETPRKSQQVIVKTYIPMDSNAKKRRNQIDLGIRLVSYLGPVTNLQEKVIEQDEWEHAWKQHFQILYVGKTIVIVPSWKVYRPKAKDIVIKLDPGMAFGTGHHPTTRMCLELLEELVSSGMNVFDLGCGSGILSIAAAKLGANIVYGLDIDPVAVAVAKSNVIGNGVECTVSLKQGSMSGANNLVEACDVAVANISSKVILEMAGDLAAVVKPGGCLIVSGIFLEKKGTVEEALLSTGFTLERTVQDGDWVAMVALV